jgi:hypothetical protein
VPDGGRIGVKEYESMSGSRGYRWEANGTTRTLRNADGTLRRRSNAIRRRPAIERLESRGLLSITPGPGLTLSPTPIEGIQSTNITVATFSTADAAGTLSSTIYWGDGTSSAGTVTAVGTVAGLTQYFVLGTHTYAEETAGSNTNAVVVQVNDTTDATVAFITSRTSVGDAPLSPFATSTISNVEGVAINPTTATFTDANQGATASDFTATVNWGDNSSLKVGTVSATATPGRFTVAAGHTYTADGIYPVTTTIVDDGGQSLVFVNQATITDAALTLGPTLALSTAEGQPLVNQVVGTFTDANSFGTAPDFTATIDWGDATPTTSGQVTKLGNSGGGAVFAITGSHTYTTVGTPTISVAVTDKGGSTIGASTSAAVSVTQSPLQLTVMPQSATAGTATPVNQVVATFIDTGNADIGYTATVDFGDGSGPVAATVVPNGGNLFSVEAPAHTYASAGMLNLTVSVTDPDPINVSGNSVAYVAPAALTQDGPALTVTPTEGASNDLTVASIDDANTLLPASAFTATINWGDGIVTPGVVNSTADPGVFDVSGTHAYADDGSYAIAVAIESADGSKITIVSTASVSDAPLTLGPALDPTYVQGQPAPNQLIGIFTDANPDASVADFTATIDWGDSTPASPGVISLIGGSAQGAIFGIYGDHIYGTPSAANPFPIMVSVADKAGSTIAQSLSANATVLASQGTESTVTLSVFPLSATEAVPTTAHQVIATFSDNAAADLAPGAYSATIDWGDGSAPDTGSIVYLSGNAFNITAPAHTYASTGVYQYTVILTDHHVTTVSPFVATVSNVVTVQLPSTAHVPDVALSVIGVLNPTSSTGVVPGQVMTRYSTPNFYGVVSQPNATIQLFVEPAGTGDLTLAGRAAADSSGYWTITSGALGDGAYNVFVKATDQAGSTTAMSQILPAANQGALIVDTQGPTITSVSFDRRHGQLSFGIRDGLSGLNQLDLVSGSNYVFRALAVSGPHGKGAYRITDISLSEQSNASAPELVTLTINNGRPMSQGKYQVIIRPGLRDNAGNALNGAFFGTFPSGDVYNGSQFSVQVVAYRTVAFKPFPVPHGLSATVPSASPSVSGARARARPDVIGISDPVESVKSVSKALARTRSRAYHGEAMVRSKVVAQAEQTVIPNDRAMPVDHKALHDDALATVGFSKKTGRGHIG